MTQPPTQDFEAVHAWAQAQAGASLADKARLFDALLAAAPHRADFLYLACADAWARAGMGNPPRPREVAEFAVRLLERCRAEAQPTERHPDMLASLACLYNEVGRFAEAEAQARACRSRNAAYHLWLAEALFEQRKFVQDPGSVVNLAAFADPAVAALAQATATPPTPAADTLFLLSGDALYFRRFVIAQALSLAEHHPAAELSVHVIDPDDTTQRLAQQLARTLAPRPITMTAERSAIADKASRRSYYTFTRFLRARQLYETTGRRVVVTDADLLFRADPRGLLADTDGLDAGITRRAGQPLANRCSASFVVFNRTLAARRLLALIEAAILSQREPFIWTLDQILLHCSFARAAEMLGLRAHFFPEDATSFAHKPDAPIWNGAPFSKWFDSPFNDLRRAILTRHGFSVADCDAGLVMEGAPQP